MLVAQLDKRKYPREGGINICQFLCFVAVLILVVPAEPLPNNVHEKESIEVPPNNNEDDDEIPLFMPSHGDIAVVYRKKWYMSKVIEKDEIFITSLTPTHGKWHWGKTDEMYIGMEDILCKVSAPVSVNKTHMDVVTRWRCAGDKGEQTAAIFCFV